MARTGRPKLPPQKKRTRHLTVPLSIEEERLVKATARGEKRLAVWAREVLLAAAGAAERLVELPIKRSVEPPPERPIEQPMREPSEEPSADTLAPMALRRPPLFVELRAAEPPPRPDR